MRRSRRLACALALALLGAGPAPIELRTLAGEPVAITHGAGEPDVVLHFFATWCSDCAVELPDLGEAARACDAARVRVIAVDVSEPAAQVEAFVAKHPFGLPVLIDPGGRAWRRAGLWGLPSNLLWTARGVTTISGPTSAAGWRERLAGLGCAAPPAGATAASPP